MVRIGKYKIGRIDWDSEDFSYGQRIELGEIFGSEGRDYQKMCDAFRTMYGFSRLVLPMRLRVKVFDSIVRGLKGWIEKEQQLLDYEPSDEELRAGVKKLTEKVGNMSTIKQLAKSYGVDPDVVLGWSYGKVFGILYTDLEERKFEKKLSKEYERNRTKH